MSSGGVLSPAVGGGPQGLGDPDDKTLRRVEIDVLIPKKMRDRAKIEKCNEEVQAFNDCCSKSNIGMVVFCRKQNSALMDCLAKWYQDEEFKKQCTEEYLQERSEYRRTGIRTKKQLSRV